MNNNQLIKAALKNLILMNQVIMKLLRQLEHSLNEKK